MHKFIFPLLILISISSFADEKFDCVEINENVATIQAERYVGIYSNEKQLRYVFNRDNHFENFNPLNFDKNLCFRSESNNAIYEIQNTENDVSESEHLNIKRLEISKLSILLLFYLLMIGGIILFNKIKITQFFNPFTELSISIELSIVLFLIISVTSSFIISNQFFGKTFYFILILFIIKLLSSYFYTFAFSIKNNFGDITTNIFKFLNLFFILIIALKISSVIQVETKSFLGVYFYFLLFIFSFFTVYEFIKSGKNIRLSHIFYYLCALEILPALYLKEYFIV